MPLKPADKRVFWVSGHAPDDKPLVRAEALAIAIRNCPVGVASPFFEFGVVSENDRREYIIQKIFDRRCGACGGCHIVVPPVCFIEGDDMTF